MEEGVYNAFDFKRRDGQRNTHWNRQEAVMSSNPGVHLLTRSFGPIVLISLPIINAFCCVLVFDSNIYSRFIVLLLKPSGL